MKLPVLALVLLCNIAHANLAQQAESTHSRVNNRVSIGCEYLSDSPTFKAYKKNETFVKSSHVKVDFISNQTPFSIVVDKNNNAHISSHVGEKISANLKRKKYRGYKMTMLDFNGSSTVFANAINLANLQCWVEMAVEKYHPIVEKDIHINVHPYYNYDYRGASKEYVENTLLDKSKQQIILLDDTYHKASLADPGQFITHGGSYLRNRKLNIIDLENIKDAAVLVSPSGHNEFLIQQPLLNVLYTGGNHNYCMLSNTSHLMEAFLKGQDTQELNITYVEDAIVVQKKTFADGLSIPRSVIKRSNVLGQMFQDANFARKYHQAYFNYFAHNRVLWFKNFYKTIKFEYSSQHFNQTIEIKGNGKKDFIIRMIYQ